MPDWLEKTLMAALALVTGGGGVAWFTTIRSERRADRQEERADVTLDIDTTGKKVDIVGQLLEDVTVLQGRVTQLFGEADAARTDSAVARREAAEANSRAVATEGELRRLRATLAYIAKHVAPIIAWIDAGAPQPAPEVPEDLRRLVDEDDPASVTRDHR